MLISKHWPTYPAVPVSTGSLRAQPARAQRFLSVRESISSSRCTACLCDAKEYITDALTGTIGVAHNGVAG